MHVHILIFMTSLSITVMQVPDRILVSMYRLAPKMKTMILLVLLGMVAMANCQGLGCATRILDTAECLQALVCYVCSVEY